MTAALHMRIERRQTQTVTPRLQHAVRLLQLSSMDFAQEVQQALDGNPSWKKKATTWVLAVPMPMRCGRLGRTMGGPGLDHVGRRRRQRAGIRRRTCR